jgi:hypothetical protein
MEQSQQEVFRTDVVMPQVACLVYCQFNDALCPGGKTYLTGARLLTVSDDELYSGTYFAQAYTKVSEDLGSHSFFLAEQTKQDMFGADIAMIEMLRFFLG